MRGNDGHNGRVGGERSSHPPDEPAPAGLAIYLEAIRNARTPSWLVAVAASIADDRELLEAERIELRAAYYAAQAVLVTGLPRWARAVDAQIRRGGPSSVEQLLRTLNALSAYARERLAHLEGAPAFHPEPKERPGRE